MKNLMSIGLIAALSGAAVAASAQAPAPTPAPTQQAVPSPEIPGPQIPSVPAKKQVPAPPTASSKEALNELQELQAMDVNRNGLVSRQEYMSHYEGLFAKMKKDSAGMISLKDFAPTAGPIAAVQ